MEKIVINTCWGGASLSRKAAEWITEQKGVAFDDYFDRERDSFRIGAICESRSDADLVSVVENMGRLADGRSALMEVVGIPDGIDWEIQEYAGAEWIAEKHRTWLPRTFSSQPHAIPPTSTELTKSDAGLGKEELAGDFIEIALCVKTRHFAISLPAYRRFQEIRGKKAPTAEPRHSSAYGEFEVPLSDLKVSRSHPHLIQVIKEVGEIAFPGDFAIGIARVPAGVSWMIEREERFEWIAEKHKAWFYPRLNLRNFVDEDGSKFSTPLYLSNLHK